jgi:hypothetical protein
MVTAEELELLMVTDDLERIVDVLEENVPRSAEPLHDHGGPEPTGDPRSDAQ